MNKVCFKCKRNLPISEFYKHPGMADGHLGKCKDCAKRDTKMRYAVDFEKIRAYEKARFQRAERKANIRIYRRARRLRSPEKDAARAAVSRAVKSGLLKREPCEVCGNEKAQAHHKDHSKPLDVQWLCFKHHRQIHGQLRDA